ncbi:hypothetical protein TRFO_11761 [Tritrichomonas foetus]|uniref:VPS9 domain-containing protein n=1 Tax=Tritrichomonas foetus TaxID=1144522 RepID=A0A1J4J5W7_9EUKA|nr:hypothetical protein TRFO_11761 [Tritrichomonas foetus]|eukprot:OHS93543.1 hypothetical protein TRFO_11761 [Tritrichomonas foetus]
MDLNEWLVSHPDIIQFILMVPRTSDPTYQSDPNIQKLMNAHYIEELTKKMQDLSIRQLPVLMKEQPKPLYLGGRAALAYHQKLFIKNLLQKRNQAMFDKFTQHAADLITLLSGGASIPEHILLKVDVGKLEKEDFKKDHTYKRLNAKFHDLENFIDLENAIVETIDAQKKLFDDNMKTATEQFDADSSFLKQVETQDNLELLFEYTQFALNQKFKNVVAGFGNYSDIENKHKNSQKFVRELIKLVYETLGYFNYDGENGDNALILVLFRYAFDKLYSFKLSPLNRCEFDQTRLTTVDPLSKYLSNCTFRQLSPIAEYCPPHTPDMKVSEVFRKDEDYFPAILALEGISFYTNPIDALKSVRDCLLCIEVAADRKHHSEDTLLPFEVTFGLFLCVAAASHIPEMQNFSDFIDECVPESGLNPVFDFAHTKLTAATSHLRKIVNMEQAQK